MDVPSFWIGLALGFTVLLIGVAAACTLIGAMRGRRGLSPDERRELSRLPLTPLQKSAWLCLVISVLTAVGITALLWDADPNHYFDDTRTRLTIYAIFLGGLLSYAGIFFVTANAVRKGGQPLDERDRLILDRAPAVQTVVVLLTVALWCIGVTESYRDEGAIPLGLPNLIFGSAVIAHMFGHGLGVLVGYWKARTHGEG